MDSKLFSHIRTVEERDFLINEADSMLNSLYQEGGLERVLKAQVRYWVSEIVREELPADQAAREKYFKELKEVLGKIKIVNLKLAFEPTDISIDKFFTYVKDIVKEPVILNFEYNPTILGGAEVTWKGEYRDFSLKRVFEEEYDSKKSEILKMMYTKPIGTSS